MWDCGSHRYVLQKVVGSGAFGIVWRAQREDGETVAIKKVLLDRRYHNRELQMMKVVEHENIIRLRHFFEKPGRKKDETYLHLVMDYLPETLRSVVLQHHKRRKPFHPDHVRAYLWQTFRALEYIHSHKICHRDIKPDNMLVDPATLKCRLCDFGCSKVRRALVGRGALVMRGLPFHGGAANGVGRRGRWRFSAPSISVAIGAGAVFLAASLPHHPPTATQWRLSPQRPHHPPSPRS